MSRAVDAAPLHDADDAVSPVIGVILMVAITVVLAAVVFVLVSQVGHGKAGNLPNIVLDVTESQDKATVISASDAYWDQLEIRLSVDGGWGMNEPATTGTSANEWVRIGGGQIGASDYLHICADTPGRITVDIRYIDLNTVVAGFTLGHAAACPP